MGRWLRAWLSYHRGLYGVGAAAIVSAGMAALLTIVVGVVPMIIIGELFQFSPITAGVIVAVAIFPAAYGAMLRTVKLPPMPKRPPSWHLYRAGQALPEHD